MKRFFLIGVLAIALGACAQTYGDVAVNVGTYGIGGSYMPGGAASASIGATQGQAVYATTVLKTGENAFVVDAGCGRKDIPSVYGAAGDVASANVTNGPNLTNAVNHGLIMGEPGRLAQLAALQQQLGPSHSALADYNDCSKSIPEAANGTTFAPLAPPAALPH